jgi:serine/threonine protein kinase
MAQTPAPNSAISPDSTKIVGEFHIVKKIGSGAMGDVFLGRHPERGTMVAIKLIAKQHATDEAFIARFKREIDVLMKLHHPNIAQAVAYSVDPAQTYLAMEYVEGPNLSDVLRERTALFESDVLTIGMHVARGLAHAYNESGLMHRDIKPMNILIDQQRKGPRDGYFMEPEDKAKIIDFGLAKSTDADDQRLTLTGIVMGTPAYMSPEQIRCEPNVDFRTDMYALGASMYHMLTGQLPYPGDAPAVIMTGHLTQPVPDPSRLVRSVSQQTRDIVMTALAKKAKDRFSDYRAMISACEKALKGLTQNNSGTGRLLRKPMVRGGQEDAKTQMMENSGNEETLDFPTLPTDKGVEHNNKTTGIHRRRASVSTSQMFRVSTHIVPDNEALEAKNTAKRKPLPISDKGSDALRKILTDKIEKTKTTARISKNQQKMVALDIEAKRELPTLRSGELSFARVVAAYYPALIMLVLLIVLLIIFFGQH